MIEREGRTADSPMASSRADLLHHRLGNSLPNIEEPAPGIFLESL
jgi:hypothetical protein